MDTVDANCTETNEHDEDGGATATDAQLPVIPILRPEELLEQCNLPSYLPTRGRKEVTPDGSERQEKRLERLYLQQEKLLWEERVVRINRVAVGEWNQSKQLIEVNVEKGKFWQTMGHNVNEKKYLLPEEGLFLLEMNVMELQHNKVPLSVQQAYELMIPYLFSLEHYQVYGHLMRLGYITTRHKQLDITDYEYQINLDQFRHRQKRAYKKGQGWFQLINETSGGAQQDIEYRVKADIDIVNTDQTEDNPALNNVMKKVDESRKRPLVCSKSETSAQFQPLNEPPKKVVVIETMDQVAAHAAHLDDSKDRSDKNQLVETITEKTDISPKGDMGKESESMKPSDESMSDLVKKMKTTGDIVMQINSKASLSQSNYRRSMNYQDKSFGAKSSETDTNSSLPSESINIGNVPGFHPRSPTGDDIIDVSKSGCKYTTWNFQKISLPNLAAGRCRPGLPLPEYLPDTIASAVKEQTNQRVDTNEKPAAQVLQADVLPEFVTVSQSLQTSTEPIESTSATLEKQATGTQAKRDATPSIDVANAENMRRLFPAKPVASNWGEYKRLSGNVDQLTGLGDLVQSPVAHLWQGDMQPLVKPSDAVSTSYLLHKLQIIQNANLTSHHVRWPYPCEAPTDNRIAFDVYQPDSGYKKNKPGLPSFQVVVLGVRNPVPDLVTQAYLLRQAARVKLLWAVVDTSGDIAFYSIQDVELPPDITLG